jgi:hypothetical protein
MEHFYFSLCYLAILLGCFLCFKEYFLIWLEYKNYPYNERVFREYHIARNSWPVKLGWLLMILGIIVFIVHTKFIF